MNSAADLVPKVVPERWRGGARIPVYWCGGVEGLRGELEPGASVLRNGRQDRFESDPSGARCPGTLGGRWVSLDGCQDTSCRDTSCLPVSQTCD